jgi:hypothetical protein
VVLARAARVAVVVRRGPAGWAQVLRWDLARPALEPGGCLRGRVYPRRCTLSPDGTLLRYCALTGQPAPWQTYSAISKLPWLTALAAWNTFGTYTSPAIFVPSGVPLPPLFHGQLPHEVQLAGAPPFLSMTGREEGWSEVADGARFLAAVPSRRIDYPMTPVVLRSPAPRRKHGIVLVARGHTFNAPAHEPGTIEGLVVDYFLERGGDDFVPLDAVVANWDPEGRLLLADRRGWLSLADVSEGKIATRWSCDVNEFRPQDRERAPEWARRW